MSSPLRGRCLIINNNRFDASTQYGEIGVADRDGSEMDVKNISNVFKRLSFEVEQIHEDLTSQVRLSESELNVMTFNKIYLLYPGNINLHFGV